MTRRWLDGVRAVTFDVGGTLIEPWPSVGQVYAAAAAERGFGALDPAELNRRFHAAWRTQHRGFEFTKRAWAELVAGALADLTPHARSVELFEAIWLRFQEASAWRVFEDVAPCLQGLAARGVRCGVISNWDERLTPTLRNLGLLPHFEFVLASGEFGHHKPATAIFAEAARRFGLPAGELLHVGDSEREDAIGARQAGLCGVWLCRDGGLGDVRELTGLLH